MHEKLKTNINNLNEIETKLKKIKEQSALRTQYLSLVEEVLKQKDIKEFGKSKRIKMMELEIKSKN